MNEEIVVAIKHRDQVKEAVLHLDDNGERGKREVFWLRSTNHNQSSRTLHNGAQSAVATTLERKRLEREVELLAERRDGWPTSHGRG